MEVRLDQEVRQLVGADLAAVIFLVRQGWLAEMSGGGEQVQVQVHEPQPQFRKAGFWVKFHGLAPEYLSSSSASALACRIGEPMEFSSVGPQAGGVLEVLVQIDITKPLVTSLSVVLQDGAPGVVSLEYRGLPRLCELCRVPGHQPKNCRKANRWKLVLKNFLCPCFLPRYRSQDDTRATEKMSGDACDRSSSWSESVSSEQGGDVSNHLMSDVSPSTTTSIVIQVPASASPTATTTESTQDDGMQKMDVVPADQGFQPLDSRLQDYVLQFSSYHSAQGRPSYLQHVEDMQLYSDLVATVRGVELVIKTGHLPRELITLALRSLAAQGGVHTITLPRTDPSFVFVNGVRLDVVTILKYLRGRVDGTAGSKTRFQVTLVSLSNTETSVTWNVVIDTLSSSVPRSPARLDTEPDSSPARKRRVTQQLLHVLGNQR
ncbi:hypothetical protein ACQJBY_053189 [Aegilops geniculata]